MTTPMVQLFTPKEAAAWLRERVQGELHGDGRCVQAGDGFLSWPGRRFDARTQVPSVIQQGAMACVLEHQGLEDQLLAKLAPHNPSCLATYAELKPASGWIADAFYAHPSRSLSVAAITGTNGKTSTAWWLAQALTMLGQTTGVVGTLGMGRVQPDTSGQQLRLQLVEGGGSGLTTPDAIGLHRQLARWQQQGVSACVMEASSIGLSEHRLAGVQVHTAVFTNLSPDHLDYHGDMQAYGAAKAGLFDWPGVQIAVINIDDDFGAQLASRLQQRPQLQLWTVSRHKDAGVRGLEAQTRGKLTQVSASVQGQVVTWTTSVPGAFNLDNQLLVLATLCAWGHAPEAVAQALSQLLPVPGRMQHLGGQGQPHVVVDYAHTPDAVDKVLKALRAAAGGARLTTVLGCGGERDVGKRAVMGRVAQQGSDAVWLTSDNPRNESPQAIVNDMLAGIPGADGVQVELDRALAIRAAISSAGVHDWVLVAGKGHENYQEVKGQRYPLSDVEQVLASLQQWRAL